MLERSLHQPPPAMLYRLALVVALLSLVGCSGALEGTSGKPDRLTVTTDDEPDAAYRNAARALLDMGYAVAQSDEVLRTVTTDYRQTEKGVGVLNAPLEMKVVLVVSDETPATIVYRGTYRSSSLGDEEMPVLKRGMSGSPSMNAWNELETAARSYPDGAVTTPPSE